METAFVSEGLFTRRQFHGWLDRVPATRRIDLTTKREAYEKSGVAEYWVVDTARRSVVIFARRAAGPGERAAFDAGTIWASGPAPSRLFPGIALTPQRIFD